MQSDVVQRRELKHRIQRDFGVEVKTEKRYRDKKNARLAIAAPPVNGKHNGHDNGKHGDEGKIADELKLQGRNEVERLKPAVCVH